MTIASIMFPFNGNTNDYRDDLWYTDEQMVQSKIALAQHTNRLHMATKYPAGEIWSPFR